MKSTTAYIVVCMLLLSALVSLIVLLITVSERPNWLLADDPPRRYIDFENFQQMQQQKAKQSKTTTTTAEWSLEDATTVAATMASIFNDEKDGVTFTLPTMDNDQTLNENLPTTIIDFTMTPVKTSINALTTLPSGLSMSTFSILSSAITEQYNSSIGGSSTSKENLVMTHGSTTQISQESIPKDDTVMVSEDNSEVEQQILKAHLSNQSHLENFFHQVQSEFVDGTVQMPSNTAVNVIPEKQMSTLVTSMFSSTEFTVVTPTLPIINRVVVVPEEISHSIISPNSRFAQANNVGGTVEPSVFIQSDDKTLSETPVTVALTKEESSTKSNSDNPVVLTLERPDATTAVALLATHTEQRHGASAASILDALKRGDTPSIAVTKHPRMLATAVIRNVELPNVLLGGVRELPNEFFGRERRVEQVTMNKVFLGRESAPTDGNEGTISPSALPSAKPGKYLSILMYDSDDKADNVATSLAGVGVMVYLPKNNGEIAVARWDEKMRTLTTLKTIRTELQRMHRMKLIPMGHQHADAVNNDRVFNVSSLTPRFVAVDGDRLKRLALLNERGEILDPREVEIPSNVGAKDLCVDNGRIYVLTRQALNGSSEIFVYDAYRLIFERRVALRTPSGENCNFIEVHGNFVYVSCQSAILKIDMENASAPPHKFSAFEGSYSLAILLLRNNRLLAAQRGRAELHLFDKEARFTGRLIDVSAGDGAPPAIFTSLAVTRSASPHSGTSTILALEYITNLIHAYTIDVDVQ